MCLVYPSVLDYFPMRILLAFGAPLNNVVPLYSIISEVSYSVFNNIYTIVHIIQCT